MEYKIVKRGEPGVAGGGILKYYANPHYAGSIDIYGLSKKLSAKSTLTNIDAIAVVTGLADLIAEQMREGKIVSLGNLGTFRISLSSRGEKAAEDVNAFSIRKSKALFRPSSVFTKQVNEVIFEKAKDLTVNPDDVSPDTDTNDQAT